MSDFLSPVKHCRMFYFWVIQPFKKLYSPQMQKLKETHLIRDWCDIRSLTVWFLPAAVLLIKDFESNCGNHFTPHTLIPLPVGAPMGHVLLYRSPKSPLACAHALGRGLWEDLSFLDSYICVLFLIYLLTGRTTAAWFTYCPYYIVYEIRIILYVESSMPKVPAQYDIFQGGF